MTIYVDDDFLCHPDYAEGRRAVETSYFDGKSPLYIEGYRLVPQGEAWTRPDGVEFEGEMFAPAVDVWLVRASQAAYEEAQEELADMEAALNVMGVSVDG